MAVVATLPTRSPTQLVDLSHELLAGISRVDQSDATYPITVTRTACLRRRRVATTADVEASRLGARDRRTFAAARMTCEYLHALRI
jgi:hypothetical protein